MEHERRICATQPAGFIFYIDFEHAAAIFLRQRFALLSLLFVAEDFCCQAGVQPGVTTAQLIFSLAAILLATRVFGWLAQRIRQPQVVGEMIAGIVLGPSLFARFFPQFFRVCISSVGIACAQCSKSARTSALHVRGWP